MRGRSSDLRTGLVPALALSLALILCLRPAFAAVDPKGNFPVEIKLTGLSRPSGIVTGRNTFVYIATVGGKLFRVDIQSGSTTLINAGGDGRALAGLCTDERGAGTLYAAGRESGRLYAFSRDGPLQRIFQLTNASTVDEPHFISDCISTRHRLLVSDAYASAYLYIRLPDRDPEDPSEPKVLGLPPPLNPDFALQGFEVPFRGAAGGAWPVMSPGLFGAASLEWTAKWNDTAYVMYRYDSACIFVPRQAFFLFGFLTQFMQLARSAFCIQHHKPGLCRCQRACSRCRRCCSTLPGGAKPKI